jgi:hypothetical protein
MDIYVFTFIEFLVLLLAFVSLKIPIVGTLNLLIAFGVVMVTVLGVGYTAVDQLFASTITLIAVVLPLVGMRR